MNEHKRLAEEMRCRARAWRIGWVGDNGLGDLLAGFAESWADRIEALGKPAITQQQIEDAIWEIAGAVCEAWEFDSSTEDGAADVQGFAHELWHRLGDRQAREAGESGKVQNDTDESVQPDQGSPDAHDRSGQW